MRQTVLLTSFMSGIGMGQTSEAPTDAARERILATAYDLFSHQRDGVLKVAITP